MKEHVAKKWVKALRSGAYKQGRDILQYDDQYCCLGVLCKIAPKAIKRIDLKLNRLIGGTLDSQPKVLKWSGLKSSTGRYAIGSSLVVANDIEGMSFNQIADIIEAYWETL